MNSWPQGFILVLPRDDIWSGNKNWKLTRQISDTTIGVSERIMPRRVTRLYSREDEGKI